ncbi:MAG: uroporphyrinogen-III C-methyltransferase [Ardenticatenaceae bacterium]
MNVNDKTNNLTIGKAYLVGAGPGRPDLITVRGLKVLREADTVLYDRLIPRELLGEAPAHAELIFVGKRAGHHVMRQEQITALLVERVRAGQQVVRLKGGDAFVFGRGGEEALALAQAGLPFEVVPGVTSAIAVPAYAGIPITHRNVASAFAVVTAHETPDKAHSTLDWSALAKMPTLIVLMARRRIGIICQTLIDAGRPPNTPAAMVSCGTTDRQQVLIATLATLPEAVANSQLPTPALAIIGDVATLAHQLKWFSPDGHASGFVPLASI